MALTAEQTQTLATDLQTNTDQTVIDALAVGNNNGLVAWYNEPAAPDFYVWRSAMPVTEMQKEHFDWAEIVANMTTTDLLALSILTNQSSVDPSKASIRSAFGEIFSGPNLVNTRTALLAAAKETTSNTGKLFADTAGGDGSEGSPAVVVVSSLSLNDIRAAVKLIP